MGATDLKDRWKTLQLLSPVFDVINRSAPRANIDHHQYELAQLSLRLIDYVVHNQASLEGAVSLDSLMDHLTQAARKMNPDDPDRPYAKVASIVFKGLFNDGRPHTVTWLDQVRVESGRESSQLGIIERPRQQRQICVRLPESFWQFHVRRKLALREFFPRVALLTRQIDCQR